MCNTNIDRIHLWPPASYWHLLLLNIEGAGWRVILVGEEV